MLENVDKTINEICDWIQQEISDNNNPIVITEAIKSLAELVSARGIN